MRIERLGIDLPDKPVDGYKLTFYEVERDTLRKVTWTYHVNTSWADYIKEPGNTFGAPIVSEWMTGDGRIAGWDAPKRVLDNDEIERWKSYFTDPIAAREKFVEHLKNDVERKERELRRAEYALDMWKRGVRTCENCKTHVALEHSYQRCPQCNSYVTY